jgi:hypothetical protein
VEKGFNSSKDNEAIMKQIIFAIFVVIFFALFCWGIRKQFEQLNQGINKLIRSSIHTVEDRKWWI